MNVPREVEAACYRLAGLAPPVAGTREKVQVLPAAFAESAGRAEWVVPLHLVTASNGQQLDRSMIGRAGHHRRIVSRCLAAHLAAVVPFARLAQAGGPLTVRITRLGGRGMDDDGVTAAAKWCRDTVALFLGVDDGPRGPVRWRYGSEPGGPMGVRVVMEAGG